jgi:TRAP transporter 4TM/12TM fusion protein
MAEEQQTRSIFDSIEPERKTIVDRIRREKRISNPALFLFAVTAIGLGVFSVYTGYFGLLESWLHRMIHLTVILGLVFLADLICPDSEGWKRRIVLFLGVVMLLALSATAVYSFSNYKEITYRAGMPDSLDQIFGMILVVLVMYASYRKLGLVITLIAAVFIGYAFFGYIFPGQLYHRGVSYPRFIDFMFNQTIGIIGVPIKVAAEYVIMFILFGAFLSRSGTGEFFIRLSFALTGRQWGGPAKAAVVASALMGTISGSGVANAVATGSITIPLMKRVGYKPHFAAAVEAAASNGGMIMPPIMASVAFLIAEFTGTPYSKIMLYGLFPALLYFFAIMLMVGFEARKQDLKPLTDEEIPSTRKILGEGWIYLLPIAVLVFMLIRGFTPMRAATIGIVFMIALSYVKKSTRMGLVDILAALEEGVSNTITVSVACAIAGIIVGVITSTGLGIKFSSMILSVAGSSLFMVLVLTMFSSIILGMGMTAAAVYIIVSALTVQALIKMGVNIMAAHFFVYFYGIASAITPPVALAAYGAAGIAGADQNLTAITACKLAIVTFLIPFAFVYNPAIMAIGSIPAIILAVGTAAFGVVALSTGFAGWMFRLLPIPQRILMIVAGIGLFTNLLWVNILGLVCLGAIALINRKPAVVRHA